MKLFITMALSIMLLSIPKPMGSVINKTERPIIETIPPARPLLSDGLQSFMMDLSFFEGKGKLNIVNRFGMLGKYQFKPATLRSIGIRVPKADFLLNEELQDSAFILLLKDNKHTLRHIIHRFSGKYYNGIFITESGILAGAHLVGAKGVMSYFYPTRIKARTVDGNLVHVQLYIKKFGGYNLWE